MLIYFKASKYHSQEELNIKALMYWLQLFWLLVLTLHFMSLTPKLLLQISNHLFPSQNILA